MEKKTPAIAEIMEREVNSIIAEPYMRLKKMKENVVASGENYLITTRCKIRDPWTVSAYWSTTLMKT